jgi:hypothetical protein
MRSCTKYLKVVAVMVMVAAVVTTIRLVRERGRDGTEE